MVLYLRCQTLIRRGKARFERCEIAIASILCGRQLRSILFKKMEIIKFWHVNVLSDLAAIIISRSAVKSNKNLLHTQLC